ncbi:MAG: 23S rRNA (pseudouridine(1915)-N(3))-methyltransferase RlmH [Clostridia bacterium]|nr:23S rRNA (pseudouridine(1915)-N(3))-methyltransferase RlmH [Clostridia bacterium]
MLTVKIICVGNLKEKYWRDAIAEYSKRLSAFCKFDIHEINEVKLPDNPGEKDISKALAEEGRQILKIAQDARCKIFPLVIEGKMQSSENLAKMIEQEAVMGTSAIAFVIGSSHGLCDEVKKAGRGISMSPMTFPHQLARVMLCEQIYRAFSINAGTRYHK